MSLRAVRRNTFYKKEFVTDVFNVNPQFKDLISLQCNINYNEINSEGFIDLPFNHNSKCK